MKLVSDIKSYFFAVLFAVLLSNVSFAQVAGGQYQKLFDLYVMGRYEDCLVKSQKMTESDKYKSQSEPYLWVSMCFNNFVGDEEMESYYPKSAKNALKYGVKFKKKDDKIKKKEGDYLFDDNEEYMYELIELALVEGKSFFVMDNYSKSSYYYKMAYNLDPENMDCQLMKGVIYLYNKNTKEGQALVNDAMEHYERWADDGGFKAREESRMAFVDGFVYYAKHLRSKGRTSEAFDVMALAIKLEPKNSKFIALYKELS